MHKYKYVTLCLDSHCKCSSDADTEQYETKNVAYTDSRTWRCASSSSLFNNSLIDSLQSTIQHAFIEPSSGISWI